MIRVWLTIARKLGLQQIEAMLLHAHICGWLNDLARRRAEMVVHKIITDFELDNGSDTTLGRQLQAKGVLTDTEAEVFSGNYYADTNEPDAEEDRVHTEPLPRAGRTGKSTRGPS
jgi:hypothetical protein